MIILYALVALFIAWIWVDYYRLIDIYDTDALKNFVVCFLFGGLSVPFVLIVNAVFLNQFFWTLNDVWWNDLLYTTVKIGMVEELGKLLSFGLFFVFFRKHITEPLDVIAYTATSALGFAAVENILYFNNYGASIINGRAILSTVGHMFDTALIGYGIVLVWFLNKGKQKWLMLPFFFLGSFAHGIYDFTLMHRPFQGAGMWLMLVYFMVTIELFATLLNNTVNNSKFFTFKAGINPRKVASRLIGYYALLFLAQSGILLWQGTLLSALEQFLANLLLTGTVVLITALRMSRFKLIPGRWDPLRISLPFTLTSMSAHGSRLFFDVRFRINGESYDETKLNGYYQDYFQLQPLPGKPSFVDAPKRAYLEDKYFLFNDEPFYLARVWMDPHAEPIPVLLKAKSFGRTHTAAMDPIVWVLPLPGEQVGFGTFRSARDLNFEQWGVVTAG